MNLIVDQGNTRIKYALFDNRTLVKDGVVELLNVDLLNLLHADYHISYAMYSSVGLDSEVLRRWCQTHNVPLLRFSLRLKLPLKVDYKTPESLGLDRVAAVVGAYEMAKSPNFMVVDAGTAITFDYVVDNIYSGGNISPGIQMRFKALHNFTQKLPLVEASEVWSNCGKSTEEAIRNGVQEGMLFEIQGYLNDFISKYEDANLFLTGGDSIFFANKLKNSIFADRHLVLYGLNRVLLDNVKN